MVSQLVRILEILYVIKFSLAVVQPVATETLVATVRSPLSDMLVYPTPTQKISKPKGCARV